MSFIKSFVTKHVLAAASAPPAGMEAVAVFFYGQAPALADISALAPEADVALTTSEGKTRIAVVWPEANMTITIDPAWDKAAQMAGMRNWTERFPARVKQLVEVQALIASFDQVSACFGTVSKPALDAKTLALLQALIANGGGFFFSRNSFYGADGLRITGYDDDPVWLGGFNKELAAS